MSRMIDVVGLAALMLGGGQVVSASSPRDRVYRYSSEMPSRPKGPIKPKKPKVVEFIGPPWPLTRQQKRAMMRKNGVIIGTK